MHHIRPETKSDYPAIRLITELAFRNKPYAGGDEQDVIDRLRDRHALTLSLVAVADDTVIGHVAFSPAIAADESHPWFALGPISVLPDHQNQGIGTALIHEGMQRLTELGALGCILTGDPAYYSRFGFQLSPDNAPNSEPAEYFMTKWLTTTRPSGKFSFHQAFYSSH